MLYAANEGYLNDVEVDKIGDFERRCCLHARGARRADERSSLTVTGTTSVKQPFGRAHRKLQRHSDLVSDSRTAGILPDGSWQGNSHQDLEHPEVRRRSPARWKWSASKMRKAQERMEFRRPYARPHSLGDRVILPMPPPSTATCLWISAR
jgi:hypothetical protein